MIPPFFNHYPFGIFYTYFLIYSFKTLVNSYVLYVGVLPAPYPCSTCGGQTSTSDSPATWVTDGSKLPWGAGNRTWVLVQQQVLITTQPAPQSRFSHIWYFLVLAVYLLGNPAHVGDVRRSIITSAAADTNTCPVLSKYSMPLPQVSPFPTQTQSYQVLWYHMLTRTEAWPCVFMSLHVWLLFICAWFFSWCY